MLPSVTRLSCESGRDEPGVGRSKVDTDLSKRGRELAATARTRARPKLTTAPYWTRNEVSQGSRRARDEPRAYFAVCLCVDRGREREGTNQGARGEAEERAGPAASSWRRHHNGGGKGKKDFCLVGGMYEEDLQKMVSWPLVDKSA